MCCRRATNQKGVSLMIKIDEILKTASARMGIDKADLQTFFDHGEQRTYGAEEWLFHESTPRRWGGIILEGEVEIVRGLHGSTKHYAVLGAGQMISEDAFLGDVPHTSGALTRLGTTVWQIKNDRIEAFRTEKPELFYRIVARVAAGISERLRVVSQSIARVESPVHLKGAVRLEHDSLGEREIPEQAYYGVQTLRAMENFPISGVYVKNFEHMIEALAFVKKAAALANHELGVLEEDKTKAISAACDELLAGKLHEHFTVDMFQGGAGTSTNMNANEVIANRGLEIMGHKKGEYDYLHPNDHVNCSQSTNDAYPTSIKLAVLLSLKDLLRAMGELREALESKAAEFADVLKMGRTENQDAVPMTLGQEFSAYAVMVESAAAALDRTGDEFHDINMGATAIGTGINSPPGYAELVTKKLSETSGIELRRARNLVEATQNAGSFVQMSATMKRAAVQISKICNDLRWMSSGPRCGLNEINLPPMQPGSSITCSRDLPSCPARSTR